jgi:hypothetical protein
MQRLTGALTAVLVLCNVLYARDYYVSPSGDDHNPGSLEKPLATIEGARDAIRALPSPQRANDIHVYFRAGTYQLKETVVFGLEDSGEGDATITYAAYPGEKPVFSSGVEIGGWNKLTAPHEKATHNAQKRKGLLHPEREKNWLIPIVNRGSMQGNLTGVRREIFTNGELSGLNLIPTDPIIKNGVSQNERLTAQCVTALGSYRGAYDIGDEYWCPRSDWMPYGLPLLKTMADSEQFAKKYRSISIVPEISVRDLPSGHLNLNEK